MVVCVCGSSTPYGDGHFHRRMVDRKSEKYPIWPWKCVLPDRAGEARAAARVVDPSSRSPLILIDRPAVAAAEEESEKLSCWNVGGLVGTSTLGTTKIFWGSCWNLDSWDDQW